VTVVASFAAVGMVVADMAESVRFYRALGLDVPEPDGDHLDVALPNGFRLMLDTVELIRGIDPDWAPPSGGHSIAFAFECESPGDVDALYARLVEEGFRSKKEPWDAFWGQRYATVLDPDGNQVDLFAAL
jgi:catechol 2,3-dioxygenase-like lactoylglutathione lyase family enzyme